MDQKIVLELDRKVADQQSTLEKAGVAGFYVTTNPQVSAVGLTWHSPGATGPQRPHPLCGSSWSLGGPLPPEDKPAACRALPILLRPTVRHMALICGCLHPCAPLCVPSQGCCRPFLAGSGQTFHRLPARCPLGPDGRLECPGKGGCFPGFCQG